MLSIVQVLVLPFQVLLQRNTTVLECIQPEVHDIAVSLHSSGKGIEDRKVQVQKSEALFALFKSKKVHPFSPISTMVVPLVFPPLFLSFFGAIHNLCLAHAGMASGGALWFSNLMVADSSFVLPVLSGLSWLALMEVGGSQLVLLMRIYSHSYILLFHNCFIYIYVFI